jgi:anti-sigma regulatory factor (Ser/Thr protein kinase)
MSPPLVRRFAARAAEIGPARRAVAAYAREHAAGDPDAVALAVSEAVTNVVLHAYVDDPAPGEVEVVARRLDDGALVVTVSDDGRGMMPHPEGPGAGLGLPLLGAVVQRLDVHTRSEGGTRLCMRFSASAPARTA